MVSQKPAPRNKERNKKLSLTCRDAQSNQRSERAGRIDRVPGCAYSAYACTREVARLRTRQMPFLPTPLSLGVLVSHTPCGLRGEQILLRPWETSNGNSESSTSRGIASTHTQKSGKRESKKGSKRRSTGQMPVRPQIGTRRRRGHPRSGQVTVSQVRSGQVGSGLLLEPDLQDLTGAARMPLWHGCGHFAVCHSVASSV